MSSRSDEVGGLTDSTRLLRAANDVLAARVEGVSNLLGLALDLADMAALPLARLGAS